MASYRQVRQVKARIELLAAAENLLANQLSTQQPLPTLTPWATFDSTAAERLRRAVVAIQALADPVIPHKKIWCQGSGQDAEREADGQATCFACYRRFSGLGRTGRLPAHVVNPIQAMSARYYCRGTGVWPADFYDLMCKCAVCGCWVMQNRYQKPRPHAPAKAADRE